jgi:hypothetical protein
MVRGRPFPKGVSGNPGGRPRRQTFTAALREKLAEVGEDGQSMAARLADAAIRAGLEGDIGALRFIAERADGPASAPPAEPEDDEAEPARKSIACAVDDCDAVGLVEPRVRYWWCPTHE